METTQAGASVLSKALLVPYSSVVLMGAIAAIGLLSGFIVYEPTDSPEAATSSGMLDTSLPTMPNKGFKKNKYDNSALATAEEDSAAFPDFSLAGKKKEQAQANPSQSGDAGFASNENLPLDRISQGQGYQNWQSRQQVRSHYNRELDAQSDENRQTVARMTAPAPLSAEELAERKARNESMERAARLENMAVNQLDRLEKGKREGYDQAGSGSGGYQPEEPNEPAAGDPATQVTLANLDEYVDIPRSSRHQNTFYGLNGEKVQPETIAAQPVPNAIEAVIHGDADNVMVTNGSTVKIRLIQDIQVGKFLIPRNTLLTGESFISGERVQIILSSVRVNSSIIPIKLRVYDIDGHAGIYVPNLAVKNQIAQSGAQTVTGGSFNMPMMVGTGGSIGEMMVGQTAAQGVNLAINGVRSLTSKKMAQQKVTIRPNYRVYLKQDSN